MDVSVRDLKSRLSLYLRKARAGGEVVVTLRGRPVARLVPPLLAGESESDAITRLRALPFVRPGRGGRIRGSSRPMPWRSGEPLLSDLVREGRG